MSSYQMYNYRMYHYTLVVHIISNDTSLMETLKDSKEFNGFSLYFSISNTINKENLENCDILIYDSNLPDFKKVFSFIKEKAVIVLCLQGDELSSASEEELLRCEALWVKPFSLDFAKIKFEKIVESIQQKEDLYLVKTYLDTTIDNIPDLVWYKDVRGSHLKVNESFCHATGKTKQDIENRGHYYIWDLEPEDYAQGEYVCLETEEEVIARRETCLFDEKVKSKYGMRQFKTYKSPIFDKLGTLIGTVGFAHDVTDLENISTELKIFLDSMPFGILVTNEEGIIINLNEKFSSYFYIPEEEIIRKNYDVWKKKTLKKAFQIRKSQTEEQDITELEIIIGRETKTFEISERPIYDVFDNFVGRICVFRDITKERQLERQILHNSITDFMTGLFNRRGFYDHVRKERGDQLVSLIYIDLDHFKLVNDAYGHQTGDEALILTSEMLKKHFSEGAIARFGGDEFIVAMLGNKFTQEKLIKLSCEFLEAMQKAFVSNGKMNVLSASMGIAQTSNPSEDFDSLIHKGDVALYFSKRSGKARCCVYEPSMEDENCTNQDYPTYSSVDS